MKKIALALIIFLTTFSCFSALAGSRPGLLALTFGAGEDYFASKRHMRDTGAGFGALSYNITREWGIEGMVGFLHTRFNSSIVDDRQINGSLFALDGVYHYPLNELVEPYVLAGAGITTLNPNRNDAVNEGNINAGLGLEYFIHKSIAFRVEARDFYVIDGGKNDVMLDGGVSILFDLC